MTAQKATPAAGRQTGAHKMTTTSKYYAPVGTLSRESPLYPFYPSIHHTKPTNFLSLAELLCLAIDPSIGPKLKAGALTPFKGNAKKKEAAVASDFHALVTDRNLPRDKSRGFEKSHKVTSGLIGV
jgi:hypothetical protein